MKVLVTGVTGMLGYMVHRVFAKDAALQTFATARNPGELEGIANASALDAESPSLEAMLEELPRVDYVVNCIGIIKPYIKDDNAAQVERAVRGNSLFPLRLAAWAERSGATVLQIATDCVYSGTTGRYGESAPHDALDAYGKTKSLGEVPSKAMHHLRCSIIGPETKAFVSLLEWFRRQPEKAALKGFTNHDWNGVTTYHYAKLCLGAVKQRLSLRPRQHVIPSGTISKFELLRSFARHFERSDITIEPVEAATKIDRTLSTEFADDNAALWKAAGYVRPPSVDEMVAELAELERGTA